MKRKFLQAGLLVTVLGFLFFSCISSVSDNIAEKFRGKWEITHFQYSKNELDGASYTFPCTIDGNEYSSAGYEIEEKAVKIYVNGSLKTTYSDAFSDGPSLKYWPSGSNVAKDIGISMYFDNPNYDAFIINYPNSKGEYGAVGAVGYSKGDGNEFLKRVSKFSWE